MTTPSCVLCLRALGEFELQQEKHQSPRAGLEDWRETGEAGIWEG